MKIQLLAGIKEELQEVDKTNYTKVSSVILKDGSTYELYSQKKQKLTNAKFFLLSIVDAEENGFDNLILKVKKKHFFIKKYGDNLYIVENVLENLNDDEVEQFGESIFQGKAFHIIDVSLKNLKKEHERSINILALLAVLIIIFGGSGYALYTIFAPPIKTQPPKPRVKPLTPEQYNYLRLDLTKKYINSLYKKANDIIDSTDRFNSLETKRIIETKIDFLKNIKPVKPYFDKKSNKWKYSNKKLKKGGVKFKFYIVMQKVFPDKDYSYQKTLNGLNFYIKKDKNSTKAYGIDYGEIYKKHKNLHFSQYCIDTMLTIDNIRVAKREKNYIRFAFQKVKAGDNVKKLNMLFEKCPIYLEKYEIRKNLSSGIAVLFKKEVKKKKIKKTKLKKVKHNEE